MVDGLRQEVAALGIRCLVIEPGDFRTSVLEKESATTGLVTGFGEYEGLVEVLRGVVREKNGRQPGDPKKAVEATVGLVKGEGQAKGREIPWRMPLGRDGAAEIKRKCEEMLKVLDDWECVIGGTDVVEA